MRERRRVEPVARRLGVAGMGPGARDDRAEVEHHPAGGQRRPGERAWQGRCRAAVGTAQLVDQRDADHDHRHRQQEVARDDPRVEVGQDGDATDHRLQGDPQPDDERQPGRAAVRGSERREEAQHGDRGQGEGQHPVAELDDAVDAELAVGDVRRVGAARPRRAAEPRAGQANRGAGDDDADVGDEVGQRERPEVPGEPVEHGVHHSHLNVRAVSRVPTTAQAARTSRERPSTVASTSAARIASPSAPEGSHWTTVAADP